MTYHLKPALTFVPAREVAAAGSGAALSTPPESATAAAPGLPLSARARHEDAAPRGADGNVIQPTAGSRDGAPGDPFPLSDFPLPLSPQPPTSPAPSDRAFISEEVNTIPPEKISPSDAPTAGAGFPGSAVVPLVRGQAAAEPPNALAECLSSLAPVATSNTADPSRITTGAPAQVPISPRPARDIDWAEAQAKARVCEQYADLLAQGMTGNQARRLCGKGASFFSGVDNPYDKWLREGVAGLLPRRREAGAKPSFVVPNWFIPAAKFFWLHTNRTATTGSVPEAVRRTISLPVCSPQLAPGLLKVLHAQLGLKQLPDCPPELRADILARERAGRPLLPQRLARMIPASKASVALHRSPKNFGLDFVSCPGSMRLYTDPATGERLPIMAGDWIEGDDATPGLAVCVPWDRPTTECARRHKVMIGRFQWLAFMDAGTDYVPSFTYVIRPRSSYRKDDVAAGMRGVCQTVGVPARGWRFERGTWESKMVKHIVTGLGGQLWTVHSPHNKIIETLFNRAWTKLAVQFPHADMGRFRGENEANCKLYEACKTGAKNPRQYFPMLNDVIKAFEEVIAEHNRTRINSTNYGNWIPEERWTTEAKLRPLDAASDWMFHPYVMEPRTVRGNLVGGTVPLFEEFSVPFEFSAAWLPEFHGAKVRLHFDPALPVATATIVLLQDWGTRKAGEVLGDAIQVNETAQYARRVLGWGDDSATAGLLARQQAASHVRRVTSGIAPGGRVIYKKDEERDGIHRVAVVEKSEAGSQKPEAGGLRTPVPVLTPDSSLPTPALIAARRAENSAEIARFERENAHLVD